MRLVASIATVPLPPSDVRQALGLSEEDIAWVRIRASLGSIVGETFLLARGREVRIAMRTSALADLEELSLLRDKVVGKVSLFLLGFWQHDPKRVRWRRWLQGRLAASGFARTAVELSA